MSARGGVERAKVPLGTGAGNGAADCCGCCADWADRAAGGDCAACSSEGGAVVRLRSTFFDMGAGGAAAVLPSSSAAASGSGTAVAEVLAGSCAGGGAALAAAGCLPLPLDFAACLDFGSAAGGVEAAAAAASAFCWSIRSCADPLYNSFGTPCSSPGTPSGKTALRSPGSFFLVSRKSNRSVGSQLDRPLEQPPSALESATSTVAAIRRCERRMVGFPQLMFCGSCSSSWRQAGASPAAPRHANAAMAASRRRPQSGPATFAQPPRHWRARRTEQATRARYGETSPPARPEPQAGQAR